MGGSPNWSTLTMRLGYSMTDAMQQAEKALGHWTHNLNDQWNIHGLVAGVGYLIHTILSLTYKNDMKRMDYHFVQLIMGFIWFW
jgi:hypothetical protein